MLRLSLDALRAVQDKTAPAHLFFAHRPLSPSAHLDVAVLDASFNPPTIAHLALAKAALNLADPQQMIDNDSTRSSLMILLLSVANADKIIDPAKDATYPQRCAMITALANNLSSSLPTRPNIAAMIINEPIFFKKAQIITDFIRSASSSQPRVSLTWLMGFDTLQRVFHPKYYNHDRDQMLRSLTQFIGPNSEPNSRIVCAARNTADPTSDSDPGQDDPDLPDGAQQFLEQKRIIMLDLGKSAMGVSSSRVRQRVREHNMEWMQDVVPGVQEIILSDRLYLARQ
jgi:nicotinamide-nucleotide adenylyltransferase